MKRTVLLFFAMIFLALTLAPLTACIELSEGGEEGYNDYFAEDTYFFKSDSLALNSDKVETAVFSDSAEDAYLVEKKSLLSYAQYAAFQIEIKKDTVLQEMCIYVKWNKAQSGAKASSRLTMLFFVAESKIISIKSAGTVGEYAGVATAGETFAESEARLSESILLKDGEWGNGTLVQLKSGFKVTKGQYFTVVFLENNDYTSAAAEDSSITTTENTENNISFICDKIMFRITK